MLMWSLWQRSMGILRQNALCPHTWKVLTDPPLIRWRNLTEKDIVFWLKTCSEEVSDN